VDPTGRLTLPDGRTLAYDDVGAPDGPVVVYLHGTPDSRLARHPDDELARSCGVRLVAVDRPGAGASTIHPTPTLISLGEDLRALLDALQVDRAGLLGWSSGGLFALAAATVLGARAGVVALAATVPPVEAYQDPVVVAALSPARQHFVELAQELTPTELAGELVPYLVPEPLSHPIAAEHVVEGTGSRGRAELDAVPGAVDQLARALIEAVAQGRDGLALDVALQLEPGLDLGAVTAPVRTLHGTEDGISPPAVGEWLHRHLPGPVSVEVVDGAHHLLFPHWARILRSLAEDLAATAPS